MEAHAVSRPLTENQLEFDFIPSDVFAAPAEYDAKLEDGRLRVNSQSYKALVIPETPYIRRDLALWLPKLKEEGVSVFFVNSAPAGIMDAEAGDDAAALIAAARAAGTVVPLEGVVSVLREAGACELLFTPANDYLRYYHYEHSDGSAAWMFVNEGTEAWQGEVELRDGRQAYLYDAWRNEAMAADYDGETFRVTLEPLQSVLLILDSEAPELRASFAEKKAGCAEVVFVSPWQRSMVQAIDYPNFGEKKEVSLPDHVEAELPDWSGLARYENRFEAKAGDVVLVEISDASEAVEVFVNGQSFGIQDVPVFRFDVSSAVKDGVNDIAIEVATTLERDQQKNISPYAAFMGRGNAEAQSQSGLTGDVRLMMK